MVSVKLRCVKHFCLICYQRFSIIFPINQCPFCHKDDTIAEAIEDSQFCLTGTSSFELKHDHAYFYQVIIVVDSIFSLCCLISA